MLHDFPGQVNQGDNSFCLVSGDILSHHIRFLTTGGHQGVSKPRPYGEAMIVLPRSQLKASINFQTGPNCFFLQIDKSAQVNGHKPGLSWTKLVSGHPTENLLWAKHLSLPLFLWISLKWGEGCELVNVTNLSIYKNKASNKNTGDSWKWVTGHSRTSAIWTAQAQSREDKYSAPVFMIKKKFRLCISPHSGFLKGS